MSTLIMPSAGGSMGGLVGRSVAEAVKIMAFAGNGSYSVEKLPTDAIGTHELTLTNVVVGSRVAIRDQANTTTLHDQIAATSTVVITLPVYSVGSPVNDWRIKVRKASAAPFYQPYETLMTAMVGSSSIYVSQIPDE